MKPRTDLLQQLANHLRNGKLLHDVFNFSHFNLSPWEDQKEVSEIAKTNPKFEFCGTNGCAIGECPAIFYEWGFAKRAMTYRGERLDGLGDVLAAAIAFFQISEVAAHSLFLPYGGAHNYEGMPLLTPLNSGCTVTKEEVAANIEIFIANYATE